MKAQVIGYLVPLWENQIEFLVPGIGPAYPRHYRHLESEPADESSSYLSLSTYLSVSL